MPQDEATIILSEVVRDLTSTPRNLKEILRKCLHICELLKWEPQGAWFYNELNGYSSGISIPAHRRIPGRRIWEVSGSIYDRASWESEKLVYGFDPKVYTEEADVLEFRGKIDWLLTVAQTGYRELTSNTKRAHSPSGRSEIILQQVRVFFAANFANSLSDVEQLTFNFASKAYVQLKYGSTIGDIWAEYRLQVEAGLKLLEMSDHLNAIQSGLSSDNPELWRTAVLECRNLLNDVANHLWKDTRQTYEHLPGDGPGSKLDVTSGKYVNRLAAYIHQKGLTGTRGKFVRDEAERLAVSIRSLASLQSEAHEPIRLVDARSAALGTYFILGELAIKTDLHPVKEYGNPAIKDE